MNKFTGFSNVPIGAHIVRTSGKRKDWALERIPQPPYTSYAGPWFYHEGTDSEYEDWDLPDDGNWAVLI